VRPRAPARMTPAPLDTITAVEPGRSGRAMTARPTSNASLTSTFHGAENDSQLCSSIEAIRGRVPAGTTTRSGSASARRAAPCAGSVASRSRPEASTSTPAATQRAGGSFAEAAAHANHKGSVDTHRLPPGVVSHRGPGNGQNPSTSGHERGRPAGCGSHRDCETPRLVDASIEMDEEGRSRLVAVLC
jgi:hypothetical protein